MTGSIHRYVYKLGASGGQDLVPLNFLQNPFTVSVLADVVSGSAQYGIEFTTDDIDGNPTCFRWTPHPQVPAGQTATAIFSLNNLPVTAIRLNLDAITGEVRFTVIQSPGSL
jgi:hypothetical protein